MRFESGRRGSRVRLASGSRSPRPRTFWNRRVIAAMVCTSIPSSCQYRPDQLDQARLVTGLENPVAEGVHVLAGRPAAVEDLVHDLVDVRQPPGPRLQERAEPRSRRTECDRRPDVRNQVAGIRSGAEARPARDGVPAPSNRHAALLDEERFDRGAQQLVRVHVVERRQRLEIAQQPRRRGDRLRSRGRKSG